MLLLTNRDTKRSWYIWSHGKEYVLYAASTLSKSPVIFVPVADGRRIATKKLIPTRAGVQTSCPWMKPDRPGKMGSPYSNPGGMRE